MDFRIFQIPSQVVTTHDLFALREQIMRCSVSKLRAKKGELERRLQQLNQQSKLVEKVKRGLPGLLMSLGHFGYAWTLLPLVSSLNSEFRPFD